VARVMGVVNSTSGLVGGSSIRPCSEHQPSMPLSSARHPKSSVSADKKNTSLKISRKRRMRLWGRACEGSGRPR
jgi:hypothetical protein